MNLTRHLNAGEEYFILMCVYPYICRHESLKIWNNIKNNIDKFGRGVCPIRNIFVLFGKGFKFKNFLILQGNYAIVQNYFRNQTKTSEEKYFFIKHESYQSNKYNHLNTP